ncbi:MAG TPA: hypothetical protein VLX28_25265 [Thermoanaerobaculia bacterium]|nr:hypothetical protein [Thermoanaerobaculia bacterium]
MSRNARRAPAALLVLLLLASPAFAAPSWPSPPRLAEQISVLMIRVWHALTGHSPAEKRGAGMDPAGLVDPGTPPQAPDAVTPADGERGPGMDPWG